MMKDHHHLPCCFIMTLIFTSSFVETQGSNGDIRCYCNLPLCVATGYMCKSSAGVCFSEVTGNHHHQADIRSRSRHGCIELLHQSRRDACEKRVRTTTTTTTSSKVNSNKFPILVCCQEDMCNYVDSLDIKIRVNTKVNHSYAGQQPSVLEDGEFLYGNGPEGVIRQDLWFKAAVIAVPIAGGFILIMLILLAVHMLRKDNRRQRQMLESRRLGQYKAHLLVNDHLTKKNDTNAKLNQSEKSSNVYKNVNIVISRDGYVCDKQVNYELHKPLNENTYCSAIVTWAEVSRKPSTPV